MDFIRENRFLKIALAIIVGLNLVVIGVLSLNLLDKDDSFKGYMRPGDIIIETVGFDEYQKQVFHDLIKEHRKEMHGLQDEVNSKRNKLVQFLDEPDSPKKEQLLDDIAELHKKSTLSVFNHFAEVRELCTQEQVVKFDKIIEEVISNMGRPKPPRMRGGPDGMPPPHPHPPF